MLCLLWPVCARTLPGVLWELGDAWRHGGMCHCADPACRPLPSRSD